MVIHFLLLKCSTGYLLLVFEDDLIEQKTFPTFPSFKRTLWHESSTSLLFNCYNQGRYNRPFECLLNKKRSLDVNEIKAKGSTTASRNGEMRNSSKTWSGSSSRGRCCWKRKRMNFRQTVVSYKQRTITIGGSIIDTADLLFDWFGFDQTSKTVVHST